MPFTTAIEHIVVLMLENRSFDHLFGYVESVNGLSTGHFANLVDLTKPASPDNVVGAAAGAPWAIAKGQGPSHSLNGTNVQLFGNKNGPVNDEVATGNGFAQSYRSALVSDRVGPVTLADVAVVMQAFTPDKLPALNELARQFVLCDRWFAEVPGPTMPNRLYIHAATSAGFAHNDWGHTFDVRTIYELVEAAGLSWGIYYSDDNEVAKFSRVNTNETCFRIYEDRFAADASDGILPNYTFIIPRFAASNANEPNNSMHAPQDIRPGDQLVADTYAALRANPDLWMKTLFVVTFDEHGGFYDHVVPPAATNPDGINSPAPQDSASFAPTFAFDRLGLRVPTILASPWLPKSKIDSEKYQHTSVLATTQKLFGLSGPLTKRDAEATTFETLLLPVARTDTPTSLPASHAVGSVDAISLSGQDHHGELPTDDTIDSLVAGWQTIAARSPEARLTGVLALAKPEKQADAHAYLRAQVQQYLRHRARAT